MMARMVSSAIHFEPSPSLLEQSPDTPDASQPPIKEPGPPLTASLPLAGSKTPAIERSTLAGEAPPQTSGLVQPSQQQQPPWPTMLPITQPTVFGSCPLQLALRGQSQSPIQHYPAIPVPVPTPPTPPQPPSANSPPARPPIASSPSPSPSPPPPLPTAGPPSTATPLLTPLCLKRHRRQRSGRHR